MDVNFPEIHYPAMNKPPESPLQKNLKARLADLQINALQAAKKAGLGDSFVRDILRGKTKSPSADNMVKLAGALSISLDELTGRKTDSTLRPVRAKVEGVPVLGRVAASTWYTADDITVDAEDPDVERIPSVSGYPVEWQFGMIVEGNCLNMVAQDGDRLVCLDLIKSMVAIMEGDLVIVERLRFDGQMRQRTAKRVKKTKSGYELWPESTDPLHQEPIRLDDVTEGDDIRVWAKVLWVLRRP